MEPGREAHRLGFAGVDSCLVYEGHHGLVVSSDLGEVGMGLFRWKGKGEREARTGCCGVCVRGPG